MITKIVRKVSLGIIGIVLLYYGLMCLGAYITAITKEIEADVDVMMQAFAQGILATLIGLISLIKAIK